MKIAPQVRLSRTDAQFTVDVRSDRKGEYFDLRLLENQQVEMNVLDVRPEMRHWFVAAFLAAMLPTATRRW